MSTQNASKSTTNTWVGYEFSFNPAIPPHRLFAGYKWKRHYFEFSVENKVFMAKPTTSDPYSGIQYAWPIPGYFISTGYSIDLLPKKNSFKINVGANAGVYIVLASGATTPAFGINSMFEFPIGPRFSLFTDIRFAMGTSVIGGYNEYPGITHYTRLMSLDFDVGFRINMFSRKNTEKAMDKYFQL
jgi:hypothetical protein